MSWPELRREVWHYLLLAFGITAAMSGFMGVRALEELVRLFVVNLVISVGIGSSITAVYRRVLPRLSIRTERLRGVKAVVVHGLAISSGMLVGALGALGLIRLVAPESLALFPVEGVLRVAAPVSIASVLIGAAIERLRSRIRKAERARLQSELAALHARIHPHFLFNGLNTIAALIAEDPKRAEEAVLALSALLRHTIEGAKNLWVPLAAEVEATVQYLDFEQLRYGDRLAVDVEWDETLGDVQVPPLVLQPLAENAVAHGIAGRGGGRVTIRTVDDGSEVHLVVEDDGDGVGSSGGTQTAQRDIRERLRLAYGGRASFEISTDHGYRVTLSVPKERP